MDEYIMKLLIVADDFTGALDTGVQFAKVGARTIVTSAKRVADEELALQTDVLVVDTETRHVSVDEAYQTVYGIVKSASRIPGLYLYKKTDSALRGNIGSELAAMLDASNSDTLAFVPAFPQQNRITVRSIQLADGKPISEGVFSKDLFEPVTCSYIPQVIAQQSDVQTVPVYIDEYDRVDWADQRKKILLFDAASQHDVQTVAEKLLQHNRLHVTAGCAGFASTLPKLLNLDGKPRLIAMDKRRLAVICGSINPITSEQIAHAHKAGFRYMNLSAAEILGDEFDAFVIARYAMAGSDAPVIVDANDSPYENEKRSYAMLNGISQDKMRTRIAHRLGKVAREISCGWANGLPVLIGGDTTFGFLSQMKCKDLYPVDELLPGCVLSMYRRGDCFEPVISKSGGFGRYDLLTKLNDMVKGEINVQE